MTGETNLKSYNYELLHIFKDADGKKLFKILRYSDGVIGNFTEKDLKLRIAKGMTIKNLKLGPYGHIEMGVKKRNEVVRPSNGNNVLTKKVETEPIKEVNNPSTPEEKLEYLIKINSAMFNKISAIYNNTLELPVALSGLGESLDELEISLDDIEEQVDGIDDKIATFGFGVEESFESINSKIDELLSNPESLGNLTDDINYIKAVVSENYNLLQLQGEMSPKLDKLVDSLISPPIDSAEQYSKYTACDKSKLGSGYYDQLNHSLKNEYLYGHMLDEYENKLNGIEMLPYNFKDEILPYVNIAAALFNDYLETFKREFKMDSADFEGNKLSGGFKDLYLYGIGVLGIGAASVALPGAFTATTSAVISETVEGAIEAIVNVANASYGTLIAIDSISRRGTDKRVHNKRYKEIRKECKDLFKNIEEDAESLKNYVDTDAFLLSLDYLYMFKYGYTFDRFRKCTPNLCYMEMLHYLKINRKNTFSDLGIHILIAYLAAKLYIKLNVQFTNDFSESEIFEEASKPSKKRNSDIFKRVKLAKHMEIPLIAMALHCMYISPDIIYEQILSKYIEKLQDDSLSPLYISSDTLVELLLNSTKYDAHVLVNSLDHDKLVLT